jgi:DNA-binding MarR family transcriptional regulator
MNHRKRPITIRRLRRLRDTLQALARYYETHHFCPAYRDLGQALDVSQSAIHGYVGDLEARGYVTRRRRNARSLQITDTGRQWLALQQPAEEQTA